MEKKKRNILIGVGLIATGLILTKRAVDKGKEVPVIGKLFKKDGASEEVAVEQVTEESHSEAIGIRGGSGSIKWQNCFTDDKGNTCCYHPTTGDVHCNVGASKVRAKANAIDRSFRSVQRDLRGRTVRPLRRAVRTNALNRASLFQMYGL